MTAGDQTHSHLLCPHGDKDTCQGFPTPPEAFAWTQEQDNSPAYPAQGAPGDKGVPRAPASPVTKHSHPWGVQLCPCLMGMECACCMGWERQSTQGAP